MQNDNWTERYSEKVGTAAAAMQLIRSGDSVFIGSACGQPQELVDALVEHTPHVQDVHVIHLLTMGDAPYAETRFRDKFKMNTFFVADNVRDALANNIGDYTPIFLSEIPDEFESGRVAIDMALVHVSPPDQNGLCSFGVSVDIVKAAAANARYIVAQVNPHMPRTHGSSFIHVNQIDMMVPVDEPIIESPVPELTERHRKIGEHIAHLVSDGSTIEVGIGALSQALAEFLKDKRDLGIHTEMFSDWIIELVECGAITGNKKTINRGKIVASFCVGSRKLYDFIDNNPLIEMHPSEYVNDPFVIAQHDRMVAINNAIEIDLTGQVCADSIGYKFHSGIGGQVDFVRGASRSRGGKPIIALPSTAQDDAVSRIVPALTEGAGVVTTRGDVHYVVTEYGVAYLHGKSIRERALQLINIAHPKFRKDLMQAAKQRGYVYEDQIELAWEKVTYPEDLMRPAVLNDGTEILLRPVKPTDEEALSEMLYSLSSESLHTRFFTHTQTFPHKDVQQLTNIDYMNELAIVGVVPGPDGEEQIVAIAQYFLDPQTNQAEVAFIVQDEWQLKGMGSFLMDYLTRIAISRKITRFYAKVLPENKGMLAIFQNCGHSMQSKLDDKMYSITIDLEQEPISE